MKNETTQLKMAMSAPLDISLHGIHLNSFKCEMEILVLFSDKTRRESQKTKKKYSRTKKVWRKRISRARMCNEMCATLKLTNTRNSIKLTQCFSFALFRQVRRISHSLSLSACGGGFFFLIKLHNYFSAIHPNRRHRIVANTQQS